MVIAGGPIHGTLYGVYTFLEDQIGVRWYSSTVTHIPDKDTITIGRINETQVPAMVYRDNYYADNLDPTFAVRLKQNNKHIDGIIDDVERGTTSGNGWCHTIFSLIPPDKYFADHPEYFALRDGKRVASEPCLANPEVLKIVVENLRKLMATNPKATYWSVSQMDNGEPCQCEQCKALDDREGTPMGSMLTFVNKVAAQFPNKKITTLAYWYTMAPPKTLKPAKNVHIVFCYDWNGADPFPSYLEGWSKIAPPEMYAWHYVIPCHNMIAPWPNIRTLRGQLKDAVDHGIRGMFAEGIMDPGSEFAELRNYILAKSMWNPNCDSEAIIDDFVNGYYGAAGPAIRKYIDAMHDSCVQSKSVLDGHCWSNAFAGTFLAPAMLAKYETIFDEAEKAVADDSDLLLRVQHSRMPLMHAELQLGYGDVDYRIKIAERMFDIAKRSNTPYFWDFNNRPADQYRAEVLDALNKEKAAKP